MGADIDFCFKDGTSAQFRDSYNNSNLAWVIGESYWGTAGTGHKSRLVRLSVWKKFFRKLAAITDQQIEDRLDKLVAEGRLERPSEWREYFKKQRDFLKELSKRFKDLDDIRASV